MKAIRQTLAVFILISIAVLPIYAAQAQEPKAPAQDEKAPAQEQNEKVFEGDLVSVDAEARTMIVKAGDKEMQFTYNEQTQVVSTKNDGQPVVVRQGSKLKIHYKEMGAANTATRIEVS